MWYIEDNVFPADEEHRLASALRDLNLSHERFSGSDLRTQLPVPDAQTVLRGSCWLFQQLQAHTAWRADLWGTEAAFDYSNYALRYSKSLLNYPFASVTFHELCWKRDEFFPNSASAVFIRPDTGLKSIDGQLVPYAGFDSWARKSQLLQLRGAARLIVASPRAITEEYRCVIVDDQLIASSKYRPDYSIACPQAICDYVHHISNTISPPSRAYVVDVAVTPDGPYIIEIGCVCCVAFYESDSMAIVSHLTKLTNA